MIITNIDQLKLYVTVDRDFDLESFTPYELDAKNEFIYRWFSRNLVNQIIGFSGEADGTEKKEGYDLFMTAFCRFVMLKYIPAGEVRISDLGITRVENDQVKTAYAQQIKSLMRSYEDTAYLSIDSLIDLMNANTDKFTEWPNSPGYTLNSGVLVKTAKEFTNIQKLYRPYSTFMDLFPNISTVQDLYISSGIPSAILDLLIANNALSTIQTTLKGMLDKALVHLTIAHGMKLSLVKISNEGVRFVGDDKDTGKSLEESPNASFASASIKQFEQTGYMYIDKAKKYIKDNPDEFGEQEAAATKKNFWM